MGRERTEDGFEAQARVRWYVLQCPGEPEDGRRVPRFGSSLAGVDVHVWDPQVLVRVLVGGEWRVMTEPAYPGYMLVGSQYGWHHIEDILGMSLVRSGGCPCPISETELDRIRWLESKEHNVDLMFRRGQSVHVRVRARTAYAGLVGRFLRRVETDNGYMAKVVFNLYGEGRRVGLLPLDYLTLT